MSLSQFSPSPVLAISSWSFHKPLYAATTRLWDVPPAAARLGIPVVELQDMFLWPYGHRFWHMARLIARRLSPVPMDRDYDPLVLGRIEKALTDSRARLVCWTVDTDFTIPWGLKRQLAYLRRACRVAFQFGARLVRVTAGYAARDPAVFNRVIAGLAAAAQVAAEEGVRLALENHGGITADADATARLVESVNSPALGVCLDFGNFRQSVLSDGLARLAPLTIHVHAKSYDFAPNGNERKIDYGMCLSALSAAGYSGAISIEYEGDGDPAEGIEKTHRLIEQHLRAVREQGRISV